MIQMARPAGSGGWTPALSPTRHLQQHHLCHAPARAGTGSAPGRPARLPPSLPGGPPGVCRWGTARPLDHPAPGTTVALAVAGMLAPAAAGLNSEQPSQPAAAGKHASDRLCHSRTCMRTRARGQGCCCVTARARQPRKRGAAGRSRMCLGSAQPASERHTAAAAAVPGAGWCGVGMKVWRDMEWRAQAARCPRPSRQGSAGFSSPAPPSPLPCAGLSTHLRLAAGRANGPSLELRGCSAVRSLHVRADHGTPRLHHSPCTPSDCPQQSIAPLHLPARSPWASSGTRALCASHSAHRFGSHKPRHGGIRARARPGEPW